MSVCTHEMIIIVTKNLTTMKKVVKITAITLLLIALSPIISIAVIVFAIIIICHKNNLETFERKLHEFTNHHVIKSTTAEPANARNRHRRLSEDSAASCFRLAARGSEASISTGVNSVRPTPTDFLLFMVLRLQSVFLAANQTPLNQRAIVAVRQHVYYKYTIIEKENQLRLIHPPN